MGWQQRGGRSYFYRSVKVNGKVHSEYVGAGLDAEALAEEMEERRERQEREHAQIQDLRATMGPAVDDGTLDELADAAMKAALLVAGYHQHARGQWRRIRG